MIESRVMLQLRFCMEVFAAVQDFASDLDVRVRFAGVTSQRFERFSTVNASIFWSRGLDVVV